MKTLTLLLSLFITNGKLSNSLYIHCVSYEYDVDYFGFRDNGKLLYLQAYEECYCLELGISRKRIRHSADN